MFCSGYCWEVKQNFVNVPFGIRTLNEEFDDDIRFGPSVHETRILSGILRRDRRQLNAERLADTLAHAVCHETDTFAHEPEVFPAEFCDFRFVRRRVGVASAADPFESADKRLLRDAGTFEGHVGAGVAVHGCHVEGVVVRTWKCWIGCIFIYGTFALH